MPVAIAAIAMLLPLSTPTSSFAQQAAPFPGLGSSAAAPIGRAFSLPPGLTLLQPIKTYDEARPQDCGNKDRKQAYGSDGSLIALCLMFSNKTNRPITVTFPPGLIFVSRNLDTQNGMLLQSITIEVPPGPAFFAPLLLYCANENRHPGRPRDLFDLGPITDAPQFDRLFRQLKDKDLSDAGQLGQALVWGLTNQGETNELLAMGIDALPPRSTR